VHDGPRRFAPSEDTRTNALWPVPSPNDATSAPISETDFANHQLSDEVDWETSFTWTDDRCRPNRPVRGHPCPQLREARHTCLMHNRKAPRVGSHF